MAPSAFDAISATHTCTATTVLADARSAELLKNLAQSLLLPFFRCDESSAFCRSCCQLLTPALPMRRVCCSNCAALALTQMYPTESRRLYLCNYMHNSQMGSPLHVCCRFGSSPFTTNTAASSPPPPPPPTKSGSVSCASFVRRRRRRSCSPSGFLFRGLESCSRSHRANRPDDLR